MSRPILAICEEKEYAVRLQEFVMKQSGNPFFVRVFSKREELDLFLQQQKVEVLLLSAKERKTPIVKDTVRCCIYLVEKAEQGIDGRETGQEIIKYQSCEKIYKEMWAQYSEKETSEGYLPITTDCAKLIGIYSPIGRCYKTSFAMTLSQVIARKHKVLYLNFEMYSGFSTLFPMDFTKDLSDLFYYFSTGEEKGIQKLVSVVENINGLDFIPPAASTFDLQLVDGKQWREFLTALAYKGGYEYIVLDLSDMLQGLYDILKMCSRIYTITRHDGIAMAKVAQYEQILTRLDSKEILDKTIKCQIPTFTNVPCEMEKLPYCELYDYVKKLWNEEICERDK